MKNYNKFISENILENDYNFWDGSREISENEFWNIFNKNCKNFDSNILISKRFKTLNSIDYIFIEYIKDRKSADGKNYYTLLINNLDSWKKYPKRQQICELNGFWGSPIESHIIIPFDNSKWGVTKNPDIWWSRFLTGEIRDINRILINREISDNDWESFKHDMENMNPLIEGKIFNDIKNRFFMYDYINTVNFLKDKYETVFNFFKIEFTPKNLEFQLLKYNNLKNIKYAYEVWTDSPCLYVKKDIYDNIILPKIKKTA